MTLGILKTKRPTLSYSLAGTAAPNVTITSPGGETDDRLQTISGTIDIADAGLTISLWDGAILLGTATPAPDGDWSANVVLASYDAQTVTATATDGAGDTGKSQNVPFTLDINAAHDDLHVVTGQPYRAYEYDYAAGGQTLATKIYYPVVTSEPYTGAEYDYGPGGYLMRAEYVGVTDAPYSSYEYDFVGGVYSSAKFEVTRPPAGATYSSYELDYNYANVFVGDKFFFTQISGQSYTGEEEDFDAHNALSRVLLTGFSGPGYSSLELDYDAGTYAGYKAFFGGDGALYTSTEIDVSAAGEVTKALYSGFVSTPYSSIEYDYSDGALSGLILNETDLPGTSGYYAEHMTESAAGAGLQVTYDNNDGTHTILGYGYADETFTSVANDTFTGGGANETFVLNSIYGADTITDFSQYMAGAGHDVVSLPTAEFADFDAVMNAARDVGADVVIKAGDGDTLTLSNLNTARLAGLAADFTFHG